MTLEQLGMWRSTGALGRGGVWTGGEPHGSLPVGSNMYKMNPNLGSREVDSSHFRIFSY